MKYFLLKGDFNWRWDNGVECYADALWRMPGIYCPAHPNLPTYINGYSYPAADFKDSLLKRALEWGLDNLAERVDWQDQWKQPAKWRSLHQMVLATLPYPVTVVPGTSFGPTTITVSGKPADFHFGLSNDLFLGESALKKIRARGIKDLFASPCVLKSKRKREPCYQLQIEHHADLAGSLDTSEETRRQERGLPMKCDQCEKEWGKLPKTIVLQGHTIPEGVSLFRLKNQPTAVFCNETFGQAATELRLTNLQLVPVETDGSETKLGFARVTPSRPKLWPRALVNSPAAVLQKAKRIKPQKLPSFPSARQLLTKEFPGAIASELSRLVQPSLRFVLNPQTHLAVGKSRFGGLPDLPEGVRWPGTKGAMIDFLLQLDLSEIALLWPDSPFPKMGLLSFFYDKENSPSGAESKDGKG
jgi:hypothetical protein